jgi:hypothetical protein
VLYKGVVNHVSNDSGCGLVDYETNVDFASLPNTRITHAQSTPLVSTTTAAAAAVIAETVLATELQNQQQHTQHKKQEQQQKPRRANGRASPVNTPQAAAALRAEFRRWRTVDGSDSGCGLSSTIEETPTSSAEASRDRDSNVPTPTHAGCVLPAPPPPPPMTRGASSGDGGGVGGVDSGGSGVCGVQQNAAPSMYPCTPQSPCPSDTQDLLTRLREMLVREDEKEASEALCREWQEAAEVIDRFLFWVFVLGTVLCSVTSLVLLPLMKAPLEAGKDVFAT